MATLVGYAGSREGVKEFVRFPRQVRYKLLSDYKILGHTVVGWVKSGKRSKHKENTEDRYIF